ncbi:MAG: glutaredoxin 3 [Nevskiales bacterium]
MNKVLMYSTRFCPFCMMARRLLDAKGVQYEEIPVDGDADMRRKMQEVSGRHTVPQVFVGERHVGGFDDLAEAERSGQLDHWLQSDNQ